MTITLSTGARYLKRGDTFDPEDHRMSHRLTVARDFLRHAGIESTVERARGTEPGGPLTQT